MNILFVCTGNTCRSPMAEGLFEKYCQNEDIKSTSAGIYVIPGTKVSDFSIKALAHYDVDISGHIPKQISSNVMCSYDLILTMTNSHCDILKNIAPHCADKVFSFGEFVGGDDISDPYGCDFEQYVICASQIHSYVLKLIERLC